MKLLDSIVNYVRDFASYDRLPPKEWVTRLRIRHEFTPDMPDLQQHKYHWLFVYGEEMSIHRAHKSLIGLEPAYEGAFTFANYGLWKHNLGKNTFPIMMDKRLSCEDRHWFKVKNWESWGKVKGEVYLINDPTIFFELDRYRQNGIKFLRKRIQIIIPYWVRRKGAHFTHTGTFKQTDVQAWTYLGVPTYWNDLMEMGLQDDRFRPVKTFTMAKVHKTYFFFTPMELNNK